MVFNIINSIKEFSFQKSWYIICCVLKIIENSFFFFSKSLKEAKMIYCFLKFGNNFQRFYIFSKIIKNAYCIICNRFSSFLMINFLKFSTENFRKLFCEIIKFRLLTFFSKRHSFFILDFYYQSICNNGILQLLIHEAIFPLRFIVWTRESYLYENGASSRTFKCGFDSKIKKKIKKAEFFFINFLCKIPFLFSTVIVQQIISEYLRVGKRKKSKNVSSAIIKILNYMSPSLKNYNMVLKIIKFCSKKKVRFFFKKLNKKKEGWLKNWQNSILFLFKLKFYHCGKKKFLLKYVNHVSFFLKSQKKNKKNNLNTFSYFSSTCYEQNCFFKSIWQCLKREQKVLLIKSVVLSVQHFHTTKIFYLMLQECFFYIELVGFANFSNLNKMFGFEFQLYSKKGKKEKEVILSFLLSLSSNFYQNSEKKTKFKLFFFQFMTKIFSNFDKKKFCLYKKRIDELLLVDFKFIYLPKKFFSKFLKELKSPLFLNKKHFVSGIWKLTRIEF